MGKLTPFPDDLLLFCESYCSSFLLHSGVYCTFEFVIVVAPLRCLSLERVFFMCPRVNNNTLSSERLGGGEGESNWILLLLLFSLSEVYLDRSKQIDEVIKRLQILRGTNSRTACLYQYLLEIGIFFTHFKVTFCSQNCTCSSSGTFKFYCSYGIFFANPCVVNRLSFLFLLTASQLFDQ